MTSAVLKPLSFAEFLRYDAPDDRIYELVEGQLVPMAEPVDAHEAIAGELFFQFMLLIRQQKLGFAVRQRLAVEVVGKQGAGNARKPDVVVITREQARETAAKPAGVKQPPLVVEVVSTNWRDDYVIKLAEYERTGIPEYWIVDYAAIAPQKYTGSPKQPTISVYRLVEGNYEVERFQGDDRIISPTFPDLELTVNQLVESTEL